MILFISLSFSHITHANTEYSFDYFIIKDDGKIYGKPSAESDSTFLIGIAPNELLNFKNQTLHLTNNNQLSLNNEIIGDISNDLTKTNLTSIKPDNETYYTLENGKMYSNFPSGYKITLSNKIPRFIKEDTYYIRQNENGQFHYYEYYGDITEYGFTHDVPYTVTNLHQVTPFTGDDLDYFILRYGPWNGSPLYTWGSSFKKAEEEFGVNALYLLSHAIHESAWGTSKISRDKLNLFGFRAYDWDPYNSAAPFANFEDSILYVGKYVKEEYLQETGKWYNGPHLKGMNVMYATDKNWADKIASIMNRFSSWSHYGYFYNSNDSFLLKTMMGDVSVGSKHPYFEENQLVKPYKNIFIDKNDHFLTQIDNNYKAIIDMKNIFSYQFESTISFYSTMQDSTDVYKEADDASEVIKTFSKGTVLVHRGEKNGYVKVMLQDKSYGWIKKELIH